MKFQRRVLTPEEMRSLASGAPEAGYFYRGGDTSREWSYAVYDKNNRRVAICQNLDDAKRFDDLYNNPVYGSYNGNVAAVKRLVDRDTCGYVVLC